MPESLDALIACLDRIDADLEAADLAHRGEIEAVAPEHRAGATNLVHYTALRQQDLRGLQNDLMDLGATSLATAEANVQAKMQAARNVLTALRGDPGPWDLDAIDQALDEGDDILDANARALTTQSIVRRRGPAHACARRYHDVRDTGFGARWFPP